jgi:hypothetical protein
MANTQPAPQAAPVALPHFRVGTYEVEVNDFDQIKTMTTGTVAYPAYSPKPNDWLAGIWFLIEGVAAGNAATVVFKADAPFSAIDHVTFADVGSQNVFGPVSGYDWLTVMKLGGYQEIGDPRSDITFSTTPGSGATGGSFSFIMYMPLEFVSRESLGTAENKSTSTTYAIEIVLAKSADVYATPPTTLPAVRIRTALDGYTEPRAMDEVTHAPLAEAPPLAGALQYWRTENVTLSTGAQSFSQRNGLGFAIRNIIYKLVDSTGSRAQGDLDWPDPTSVTFGRIQLNQRFAKIWQSKMGKDFGWTSTSTDVSLGREAGVYPLWFTQDFGLKPGQELRNGYLVTQVGNQLQWAGTVGGSGVHTLNVLTNWVVPPNNDTASLRAR